MPERVFGMESRDLEDRRARARRYYAQHRDRILARRRARKAARSKTELEHDEEQRKKRSVRYRRANLPPERVASLRAKARDRARNRRASGKSDYWRDPEGARAPASGATASVTGRASARPGESATANGMRLNASCFCPQGESDTQEIPPSQNAFAHVIGRGTSATVISAANTDACIGRSTGMSYARAGANGTDAATRRIRAVTWTTTGNGVSGISSGLAPTFASPETNAGHRRPDGISCSRNGRNF